MIVTCLNDQFRMRNIKYAVQHAWVDFWYLGFVLSLFWLLLLLLSMICIGLWSTNNWRDNNPTLSSTQLTFSRTVILPTDVFRNTALAKCGACYSMRVWDDAGRFVCALLNPNCNYMYPGAGSHGNKSLSRIQHMKIELYYILGVFQSPE